MVDPPLVLLDPPVVGLMELFDPVAGQGFEAGQPDHRGRGAALGLAAALPLVDKARGMIAWIYTPWWLPPAMASMPLFSRINRRMRLRPT